LGVYHKVRDKSISPLSWFTHFPTDDRCRNMSGAAAKRDGSKFLMMVGTSEMVQLDLSQFQLHMSKVCRHPYFGGNRWRKVAIATHSRVYLRH
jgi:hypothetical protein